MLFIYYSDNWADEMDISGSRVMSEKEYEEYIARAKYAFEVNGTVDFGIGSNESIEFESFEVFEQTLTVHEITEEDMKILVRFGLDDFGHFPELL